MTKELTTDLLKISQLAKATDTNVTTLKYYVKEGLIQPVFKTTKNMAYYSHDCIQRVNMIRSLQKEHFYPLAVIKGYWIVLLIPLNWNLWMLYIRQT